MLYLLRDLSSARTITAMAKEFALSRVGIWRAIKRLERERYIVISLVGTGKTSTSIISLNWENPLVEKILSLYLSEQALKQKRWLSNFRELEKLTDFAILYGSILHSSHEANDIDILSVTKKKNFIKIQKEIDTVQKTQSKKIHAIHFTEMELKSELKNKNRAFIDAIKRGVILFGQDNFVKFMKGITR